MSPMRPPMSRDAKAAGLVDKDGIPVTYTPTTHRISKAKKGKKVHVCQFGCGKVRLLWLHRYLKTNDSKVFTRAEHRK